MILAEEGMCGIGLISSSISRLDEPPEEIRTAYGSLKTSYWSWLLMTCAEVVWSSAVAFCINGLIYGSRVVNTYPQITFSK